MFKCNTGKQILTHKAYENEIEQARLKYPDLCRVGDAYVSAFAASEEDAKRAAKRSAEYKDVDWSDLPLDWRQPPPPLAVPSKFAKYERNWTSAWKRGWYYNHRRYYNWFRRKNTMTPNTILPLDSDRTDTLENGYSPDQANLLPKPLYDSQWLLYDAGEYKVLEHNLKISPDKLVIVQTCMDKDGQSISMAQNCEADKIAFWEELTETTIRVKRHYHDDTIEAVRIRIWAHE